MEHKKMAVKPPQRKSRKGLPPSEVQASSNLTTPDPTDLKPLNFKVPAEFRKAYKSFAVDHDMTMVDLLMETFAFYKEHRK